MHCAVDTLTVKSIYDFQVAAVKHLLSPVQGKDDPTNKAKRFFQETQDAKTALKMMPNFKSRECMLLKALHRHGMDHEGCTKALLNIPYAMRQLYVHSYCSLVWNKMVTQRMKLFGTQLVEGDLVLPAGADRMSTRDQVRMYKYFDQHENLKVTSSHTKVLLMLLMFDLAICMFSKKGVDF